MNQSAKLLNAGAAGPLRRSKGDTVYHAVKRAILLGQLGAGEAILEQQVAATMGCSQGTVREALLRLQHDGLVVRRGYQGTMVSDTSFDEAVQMACIRLALETESARRAALAMTANDLEVLDSIVDRISAAEASHDGYALSELDREFHLTIFRSASLTTLEPILTRCALHIHRFTFGHSQTNATPDNRVGLPSSADQHRELRDALVTAAPDTAAAAMREHIEVILGYWSPNLLRAVRNADWRCPDQAQPRCG